MAAKGSFAEDGDISLDLSPQKLPLDALDERINFKKNVIEQMPNCNQRFYHHTTTGAD